MVRKSHIYSVLQRNDKTLKIYYDGYPDNPRKVKDAYGHVVCFYKDRDLGDKHDIDICKYITWQGVCVYDLRMYLTDECGAVVLCPIYPYDFMTQSVGTIRPTGKWDAGLSLVGFAYVTMADIRAEHRTDELTPELLDEIRKRLEREVDRIDAYLRGDVFRGAVYGVGGNVLDDDYYGFYGAAGIYELIEAAGFAPDDVRGSG